MTTSLDVAQFMLAGLRRVQYLYQEQVVYDIQRQFGDEFVYTNDNGNLAISKEVLKAFRGLAPDIVWESGERLWRERQTYDSRGRRQE